MLMVVFGAGASFDSASHIRSPMGMPYRPPLADELFQTRAKFSAWIQLLGKCNAIVNHLRPPLNSSVEQELQRYMKEAETSPRAQERQQQLAAVQFYLQSMLFECEQDWKEQVKGPTNYKDLLDQIDMWRRELKEKVCLVTFNYDTMLEDALPEVGIRIQTINDYVANPDYKIIKLHGSVNWAHRVNIDLPPKLLRPPLTMAKELIERAALLKENKLILRDYHIINRPLAGQGSELEYALFPALAIPVENKQASTYECPESHLQTLGVCVPQVSKILIIGWRAAEADFLRLLKDKLGKQVHVMAVNGGKTEAERAVSKLLHVGIQARCDLAEKGFSDFVNSREVEGFLRSP